MDGDTKRDFGVLYTHQKTKKSKTWQDGRLRLSAQGTRATLLDEKGSKLDTVYVKPDQVSVGNELESDRYLITIEEEKATQASTCSTEVHQQQQQQQHQPTFGSQKRMPLKRKRMGFTVPRQASKKLATEDSTLTSTAVSHTPAPVVDQPVTEYHKDPVTKPTLFSMSFTTAGKSKNFKTDFLNVYDGGMQEGPSENLATCVSPDGESPGTCYTSDLTGRTFQGNLSPVTPCSDDSCALPCFDAETPNMDSTRSSNVSDFESTNNNFWQNNQQAENGRTGCHESDELEQLKENIPNSSLSYEQSLQKSRTHLTENPQEANSKWNSHISKKSAVSAGRRSTSQILALLGKGKAKFKPPIKESELEADSKLAPTPTTASDSQGIIAPTVNLQNSEHSQCSGEVDVMLILGQADVQTAISCINPPSDNLNLCAVSKEPSLDFNRQDKTETSLGESSALSVKQEVYPESVEKGTRCEVQITKGVVGRDGITRASDSSRTLNRVEPKISDQDTFQVGSKKEDSCHSDRKDNYIQNVEILDHDQEDKYQDSDMDENSNHSNRKQNRSSQDFSNDRGDTIQESRCEDSFHSDKKQDMCRCQQDEGIIGKGDEWSRTDKMQAGSSDDYRDHAGGNQFTRNHGDIDTNMCIQEDGGDKVQENCNRGDEDKIKINDEKVQEEVSHIGTKAEWNMFSSTRENSVNYDGNEGFHKDDIVKGEGNFNDRNRDDRSCDKGNCDERNQDEGNNDERNQEEGDTDERNQDKGNSDDRSQDERNQDEGNYDERNQEEGDTDDRNQEEGVTDDGNQEEGDTDDRNQDGGSRDVRNQEEGDSDERNQEEGDTDERNQEEGDTDDRNQEEGDTDDRNQEEGDSDDRNQEEGGSDDRNQDGGSRDDRNQEEGDRDDRNQEEGDTDDRNKTEEDNDSGNPVNRNTCIGKLAESQLETNTLCVSLLQEAKTGPKEICTMCGVVFHSAQEVCDECANQIEGGFELSWNSTPEISGNLQLEQLKEKSNGDKEIPLAPLSTHKFFPQETIKTKVKDVSGKVLTCENLLEDWLSSVEPFTNTEDISDSVVPQIGALQPRLSKHEGLQKLDIVQEASIAQTDGTCLKPSTGKPIISEQCVPEQPDSSSEDATFSQDSCSAVNDASGELGITPGVGFHSDRGTLGTRQRELPSCISQEQMLHGDPALAFESRHVNNPSLKTYCDIPQYHPVNWKGVARRSKQEIVSQKVGIDEQDLLMPKPKSSLQVWNTTDNQTGNGNALLQDSHKAHNCSFINRLDDLTTKKELASMMSPSNNLQAALQGTPSQTSNSRWKQDASLIDTWSGLRSDGCTVDGSRGYPNSRWKNLMGQNCGGDCLSMFLHTPMNMPRPDEEKMESQFPQSVNCDSLSDYQGRANQLLNYERGTVGLDAEGSHYEGTESNDDVDAQWNLRPSLQIGLLSPRCWPMVPGYSQQYAELHARCDEQQEIPVLAMEEDGPGCGSQDLRILDRSWPIELHTRNPSSVLKSLTQEAVQGGHSSRTHPEGSGMSPPSQLKRPVSDDLSFTSEGSFPFTDKETKKKTKMDNYWYNPVSSGTVRRGTEAATIFQAKARREAPSSKPIHSTHQVPHWMQEENTSLEEYLRCKTYHPLQLEASQWDEFQQNSSNLHSVSGLEREYTIKSSAGHLQTSPPMLMFDPPLTFDDKDIGLPIYPTPDTNSEFREYLSIESPGYIPYQSSDQDFKRSHVLSKNASFELNEDAVHDLLDSHPEVKGFMPAGYQMLETPALIHRRLYPTSDTISVPGVEGNIGLPRMEATSMLDTTKLFFREDSGAAFQGIPTPHSGRGRGCQTPLITVSGQTALPSGRSICGDLFFPSAAEIQGVASLQRQVHIPVSFSSVAHYKQVLTAALKEHLNIILFELSQRYHSAKEKADVRHLDSSLQPPGDQSGASTLPQCDHGNPAKMVCVKKEGANKGKFFYACSAQRANQCKFFMWADKFKGSATNSDSKSSGSRRPALTDPTSATMYFKSHNIKLYYGCELQKRSNYSNLMPGAPVWIRKHKQQILDNSKKKLYLKLSRKESSSAYGKEDIWVISKDLTFDPRSTFLARSVYHGPSSNNDLEVEPLYGYSTSNWTSSCTVHALLACNASSELTCLNTIQEFINVRTVPILPFLLGNRCDEAPSAVKSRLSAFKPPAHQACSSYRSLGCAAQEIEQIASEMIERHHLNSDQAAALRRVALMFGQARNENANPEPVTLIHGVFGAGKSFLLAVTVLFLLLLFELSDALHPGDASQQLPWKILIASTTNVAVDRILLGLLQLGFEDFIRVGSVKKIAKPVLPYSVHASDNKDSQEIRDLYEMLKTDLTPTEKHHVRRSIERQRLGRNKDLLGRVKVVGVTCAASSFPCMSSLKFPVILLDECSQMTEPSSLLPIARFQCEKLVLVGDPKQLDPTIQGSEAAHRHGLEQTLFDRLILLGCEPILLRTQYRCHPSISAIANCLFYDQQLIDGVTAQDRPPLAPIPTLCFYSVSGGKECCASDGSYYNEQEASFVLFLIETMVLLGVEPADIGVITLYKAQTVKINVLLQESKLSTRKSLKAIKISTVDAFQGGEKGVIILSCVRTDFMGFADSDKRTNVALTRSKNHLLIVANLRILSANNLWGKVIDQCKDAEDGIQSSQAFIKHWTPKLETLAKQDTSKDQTGSEVAPPENSSNFSPTSEVKDSIAKEARLSSPRDSSPSYSPLSTMEESEGDTSLNANEQEPCFDIGDLQDILDSYVVTR